MAYREKPLLLKMIEEGESPELSALLRREADLADRPGQLERLNDIADAVAWLDFFHDFELARVRNAALEEAALAAEKFWYTGHDTMEVAKKIRSLKDKE